MALWILIVWRIANLQKCVPTSTCTTKDTTTQERWSNSKTAYIVTNLTELVQSNECNWLQSELALGLQVLLLKSFLPGHGWCNIKINVDHLISSVHKRKMQLQLISKTIAWTNIIRNPFTRAGRNLEAPLHISSKASILYSVSGGDSKPTLVFWTCGK